MFSQWKNVTTDKESSIKLNIFLLLVPSIFDLQSSQPDDLLPTLLERAQPEEVDTTNKEQRKLYRVDSCFSVYTVQQVFY